MCSSIPKMLGILTSCRSKGSTGNASIRGLENVLLMPCTHDRTFRQQNPSDFFPTDVGSDLSCIHTVTEMLANNSERSDVLDILRVFSAL